jgi:hypothetical protein
MYIYTVHIHMYGVFGKEITNHTLLHSVHSVIRCKQGQCLRAESVRTCGDANVANAHGCK